MANSTVGTVLTQTRTVTNGLFTAELDFGVGAFNGQERWIGVEAKQGAASYVALTPRTKLNATPYALYALNYPEHDHFGDSWSGFATNGLSVTNSSTDGTTLNVTAQGLNSIAVKATNTGICPEAPETCYGVWGIATTSPGGSGFGGVGVRGDGSNAGVLGTGPQYGVYGFSSESVGVAGDGTTGVTGNGTGPDGIGVRGVGTQVGVFGSIGSVGMPTGTWAGFFDGADVLIDQNLWTNGLVNGSDARLKSNIHDIPYGLDKILAIRPVSYAWNDDTESKEHLGVIAQEIESVLPGVVTRRDDADGMLAVNYIELIPVLIKAIQEQQVQIEALQAAGSPTTAQDVPASLASSAPDASDARLAAIEAELAAIHAEPGGSNVPWGALAVGAIGSVAAGFALGKKRS